MYNTSHSKTARSATLLLFWRNHALAIFQVIISVFVILLLYASIRMVAIAVSSQPDCVQHRKANEKTELNYVAAKSSC